jgi:hypothetical protein
MPRFICRDCKKIAWMKRDDWMYDCIYCGCLSGMVCNNNKPVASLYDEDEDDNY